LAAKFPCFQKSFFSLRREYSSARDGLEVGECRAAARQMEPASRCEYMWRQEYERVNPREPPGRVFLPRPYNDGGKTRKRSPREGKLLSNDPLLSPGQLERFEQVILPHLDSAYNLARWLTRDEHDAEDVVQDAYLRAAKFFDSFRGGDARPWLITIVRRACYDWLERNRPQKSLTAFDEELHSDAGDDNDPMNLALRLEDQDMLRRALSDLPVEFREVLVLRELEGLSYKEIASITNLPPGTVMSRLSRARDRLRQGLVQFMGEGS
jgi:RNA polymerase sigma factor (sigma-70 family)